MGNKDFPDLCILSGAMISAHGARDELFLNAKAVKEKYISKQKVKDALIDFLKQYNAKTYDCAHRHLITIREQCTHRQLLVQLDNLNKELGLKE